MHRKVFFFIVLSILGFSSISARSSQMIVNDKVSVAAGYYRYYQFGVSERAAVRGRFVVEAGDDVEVYILDQDGFENFKRRKPARTWYNSGRVHVDTLNVPLPRGSYYLVISNHFSWVTNKLVAATIRVDH